LTVYQKSNFKAAAFDSIVTNAGLAYYYPFKTTEDTTGQTFGWICLNLTGNSWMGNYLYHDVQQHYFFMNQVDDTIAIHTQENIGHNWTFYQYPNGAYLSATINSINIQNIGGINDTIKTFALTYFNSLSNIATNDWSLKEIQISRNFGIIKCPNFNFFPADTNMWFMQLNLNIATTSDIYNFNIGDKFFYKYFKADYYPPTEASDYYLNEILNKNIDIPNQQIIYTIQQSYYDYNMEFPAPAYIDTIIESNFTLTYPYQLSMGIPEKTEIDSFQN